MPGFMHIPRQKTPLELYMPQLMQTLFVNKLQNDAAERAQKRQIAAERRGEEADIRKEKRTQAMQPEFFLIKDAPGFIGARLGSSVQIIDARQKPRGWLPKTKEEAIELKRAGQAPAYKLGTLKDFNVGNQSVQHVYTGPEKGWAPTGRKAPRFAKTAQGFLLPDNTTVLSYDGGRTYKGKNGKTLPMPYNAVKTSVTMTGQEIAMMKAKKQAEGTLRGTPGTMPGIMPERAAQKGTGPYRMLAATIDAILGGMGADLLIGKEGFFPDTQENRQLLRTIKQVGKSALMNSSRGAIWEQEKIDKLFPDPNKLFANPRTEARKFKVLREVLLQEKDSNNRAIVAAITPEEVSGLRKSNIDINKLLALIGKNTEREITTQEEFDALPSGSIYFEEGKKFRKP